MSSTLRAPRFAATVFTLTATDIYQPVETPLATILGQSGKILMVGTIVYNYQAGAVPYQTLAGGYLRMAWDWADAFLASDVSVGLHVNQLLDELTFDITSPYLADRHGDPALVVGQPVEIYVKRDGALLTGALTAATPNNDGSLYAVNDTGTFDGSDFPSEGGATYIVTSVDIGGAVTGFDITGGGAHYGAGAPGLVLTPGGGQPGLGGGATANATATDESDPPGDGIITVSVGYSILDSA